MGHQCKRALMQMEGEEDEDEEEMPNMETGDQVEEKEEGGRRKEGKFHFTPWKATLRRR